MSFYISHEGKRTGPYELIDMIRKIRSGGVSLSTLVYTDNEMLPRPLGQIPILSEAWADNMNQQEAGEEPAEQIPFNIRGALSTGWYVVDTNQRIMLLALLAVACVWGIGWKIYAMLPGYPLALGALALSLLLALWLDVLSFFMLRLVQGKMLDAGRTLPRLATIFPALSITAAGIALLVALPMYVISDIGIAVTLSVLTFLFLRSLVCMLPYAFSEPKTSFARNVKQGISLVAGNGIGSLFPILALHAFMLAAFACLGLPAIIIMPIVLAGLADHFDRNVTH